VAQRGYRALLGVFAGVDLLVETPDRLARLRDAPGLVYRYALREERVIYERSPS